MLIDLVYGCVVFSHHDPNCMLVGDYPFISDNLRTRYPSRPWMIFPIDRYRGCKIDPTSCILPVLQVRFECVILTVGGRRLMLESRSSRLDAPGCVIQDCIAVVLVLAMLLIEYLQ